MTTLVTPGIDLWDLGAVWAKRNLILEHLRAEGLQNMPGVAVGGPWPAEWVTLFERWAATGSDAEPGHHHVLAKPDGPYQVRTFRNWWQLTATVTAPTGGCRVWFGSTRLQRSGATTRCVCSNPRSPASARPHASRGHDTFTKGDATKVVIRDADGTHEVAIP